MSSNTRSRLYVHVVMSPFTSSQAINQLGLRVVLDVVYNHLSDSGPASKYSVLDKVRWYKVADEGNEGASQAVPLREAAMQRGGCAAAGGIRRILFVGGKSHMLCGFPCRREAKLNDDPFILTCNPFPATPCVCVVFS